MTKEPIDLWIEALESGGFEQTKGVLCRDSQDPAQGMSFCCLGIACEVAINSTGAELVRRDYTKYWDGEEEHDGYIPKPVYNWLGLDKLDYWAEDEAVDLPLSVRYDEVLLARLYELRSAMVATDAYGHCLVGHPNLANLNDAGFTFAEIAGVIRRHILPIVKGKIGNDPAV